MAHQRKPQQVVLYIELEDNVGQILGKIKKEVVVTAPVGMPDHELAAEFQKFVDSLPTTVEFK